MATEPLLVVARELMRGSAASFPLDVEVVASAVSTAHFAVLLRSRTKPNCVRLGVFQTDTNVDVGEPEILDLVDHAEVCNAEKGHWTLTWSSDQTFLVIGGHIVRSEGESNGVMWIFARPEWLAPLAASSDSTPRHVLLCVDPSKHLAAKSWNPVTGIVHVFFPTSSGSKVVVLSEDGIWLSMSVQVAKLALLALDSSMLNDTADVYTLRVVKKLTEWHAGITAACYDFKSSVLIVSGGMKSPSSETHASSLSVWKVPSDNDDKQLGELLDFTIIGKGPTSEGMMTSEDETELSGLVSRTDKEKKGLLASVKSTLCAPLKMMVGSDTMDTCVTPGFIHHLAMAPNGNFVSMVDDLGRIAIRQIDACADVLKWHEVEDEVMTRTRGIAVKMVVWLTSELLAMTLLNNSVMYLKFSTHFEDETTSLPDTSSSESEETFTPSARLVVIRARHFRPAMDTSTCSVQTLAFDVNVYPPSETQSVAGFKACELVVSGDVWAANQVENVTMKPFLELLMDAHKIQDALEVIALYGGDDSDVNADTIHRRVWLQYREKAAQTYEDGNDDDKASRSDFTLQHLVLLSTHLYHRGERDEFLNALNHLRAIADKRWVLDECLHLVVDDSSTNMKKLLELAWDAWTCLSNGNEVDTELLREKEDLQRFLYRLETLRRILCEEEDGATAVANDHLFDGAAFVSFRSSSIVPIARQFAREGRVTAMKILLHRHGWNLIPHWLDILELLPPSVPPSTYAALLLAIPVDNADNGEVYTLQSSSAQDEDDHDSVQRLELLEKNRLYDLTDAELLAFETHVNVECEERHSAYSAWLLKKIMELDTRYGQLVFAYELSRFAIKCLSGWSNDDAKKPVQELALHTERLYKCVYVMHVSPCCLLSLEDWSRLSMHDQAMMIIGTDDKGLAGDVAAIVACLEEVFVAQRRDRTYALDELLASVAQATAAKSSLPSLTLAAQLIQRSNPSIASSDRWIQNNAQLLKTALDVVYSVNVSDIIGGNLPSPDNNVYGQCYLPLIEQLWTIFQSLPARSASDSPEMALLQVAVDEMEDLLISVDVLSKYGVVSSPRELKCLGKTDDAMNGTTSVGPLCLLEQMCSFAFCSEHSSKEKGGQWLDVLQDAVKLKEHAFGERLSQEMILDVVLKHLLASGFAYVEAAHDLVNHWIASDGDAVEHVLDGLLVAIRRKLDTVTGYSEDARPSDDYKAAMSYIEIVRQLLCLSLWDEGDRAVSRGKERYEKSVSKELDIVHACELLDLLTYGTIKVSPSQLRSSETSESDETQRLDVVCQVFVSNPSNYKPSVRAKEWLTQHAVGSKEGEVATDVWDEPLAAVMHLATLLRVESRKLEIWMKGAYAALYCMDYEVAYDLTMQVIDAIPDDTEQTAAHSGDGDELTLLHLVSLVLDLVSASSFRSWGKKRTLCCTLLSAAHAPSMDLFAHQVTDLVLSWLEKIEAIQALMGELGLSDTDVMQRRQDGGKSVANPETVLLNELKVVVDLLYEEKKDRPFLLRLLQRGVQLTFVLFHSIDEGEKLDKKELMSTYLEQLIQLCVDEATEMATASASSDSDKWRQYMELSCSYLVVLSGLNDDDDSFESFCTDKILSRVFLDSVASTASPRTRIEPNAVLVRSLHHFFLLEASHATTEKDTETLVHCRERFEALSCSYELARRMVNCSTTSPTGTLNDAMSRATKRHLVYMKLAQRCQERLISQKKSQELEQMSAFFNTELDLDRFSHDESYRSKQIMALATKKEHLQLSRQFASKYGIDEYECVLTYIKTALVCTRDWDEAGRREQLDRAFAIDDVDIVEEALERPESFGHFLLKGGTAGSPSLYEAIDGTDHVGVLLVLRMVLECSKRLHQEAAVSMARDEKSLFPLSQAATDRLTLLFMCLKKLKDIVDSLDENYSIDLKLVVAATTSTELLTPLSCVDPQAMLARRQVAVEAVRPLLTMQTIKLVTKILRKLHRVTSSSMVMIYINDLLLGIWNEHGALATSDAQRADLATYAYESCVPCLSVLSNEHLMLFHCLFLDGASTESLPELVAHVNLADEFYGQQFHGLQRYGALLTLQKRVDVVADTLSLFQSKFTSWQASGSRSNVSSASSTTSSSSVSWDPTQLKRKEQELRYLERKLAETMCCLMLSELQQMVDNGESKTKARVESVAIAVKTWFAMDSLQQAANEEFLHNAVLRKVCLCVNSVDLASLVMELVLRAGGSKSNADDATHAIGQSYKMAVMNVVNRCMGSGDDEALQSVQWVERLAWTWATGSSTSSCSQMNELMSYFHATSLSSRDEKSNAFAVYERLVMQLTQSPSMLLKEIGASRLGEIQASSDDTSSTRMVAVVREAVLGQWKELILLKEEQQKWTEAAVLSHVLLSSRDDDQDNDAVWDFGLRVKAVWSAIVTKHKMEESAEAQHLFKVPSHDILHRFPLVFEELLAFVETCCHQESPKALRFAETATLALSTLLVYHDNVRSEAGEVAQVDTCAWHNEQRFAVQARAHRQFQVDTVIERSTTPLKEEVTACYEALFARGVWGARLLTWYTSYAFAALRSKKEATEAVVLAQWEASNIDRAIQLLLMCPFDDLREKYMERLLLAVRQLPQGSSNWFRTMELALLRFDVAVLVQYGLHASMVEFLRKDSNHASTLWTSSGAYVVCALVTQGEFAAAGRLTCALRRTHPLLWDGENARLLLASYLRSLASVHHTNINDTDLSHLQHEVYTQTFTRFANALH